MRAGSGTWVLPWLLAVLAVACTARPWTESDATAGELIERGRSALDADDPAEAQRLFELAAERDEGSFETRMWVLRAWLEQGRNNDALDALDALRAEGRSGPDMDYLYGMAFARRGEDLFGSGVDDAGIRMNFDDAFESLGRALEANAERYYDAHLPRARAGWYTQRLEEAREHAREATRIAPDDGDGWLMLGRIALSQFEVSRPEGELDPRAWPPETSAHLAAARDAFATAVERYGRPLDDLEDQRRKASAAVQLGHALAWARELDAAAEAYATAIAWAPYAIDFSQLRGILQPPAAGVGVGEGEAEGADPGPPARLLSALEQGAARHAELFGPDAGDDATLAWWLGYARYLNDRPLEAERALLRALDQEPGFVNAWLYVALARYQLEDWGGAIDALRAGWEADSPTMVAETRRTLAMSLPRIDRLVSVCVDEGRTLDAAVLSELSAEAAGDEPRHWNNLGLFMRDAADELVEAGTATREGVEPLYESSLRAYRRSLELVPTDPQVMNDTAVLLDYYLDRELPSALAMYARARDLARERLADEDLAPADRERFEQALEDATRNERALRERMQDGSPPRPPEKRRR